MLLCTHILRWLPLIKSVEPFFSGHRYRHMATVEFDHVMFFYITCVNTLYDVRYIASLMVVVVFILYSFESVLDCVGGVFIDTHSNATKIRLCSFDSKFVCLLELFTKFSWMSSFTRCSRKTWHPLDWNPTKKKSTSTLLRKFHSTGIQSDNECQLITTDSICKWIWIR